jgi:nucleolar pre-ribosomal-associated protein 1
VDPSDLLNIIDKACDINSAVLAPSVLDVLESALDNLKSSFTRAHSTIPISRLLRLCRVLPDSNVLEEMIAIAVTSHLPPCHGGQPPRAKTLKHFSSPPPLPTSRNSQLSILPTDFILKLFQKAHWAESTSRIVSGIIYIQPDTAKEFATWINSGAWTTITFECVLPAVHALLDSLQGDAVALLHDTAIIALFERMLPQHRRPEVLKHLCIRCICIMIEVDEARQQHLADLLHKHMQCHAVEQFAFESICIASRLQASPSMGDLATELAERGLQWGVRHFSGPEGEDEEERQTLVHLSALG